jgi:hypothetical protein
LLSSLGTGPAEHGHTGYRATATASSSARATSLSEVCERVPSRAHATGARPGQARWRCTDLPNGFLAAGHRRSGVIQFSEGDFGLRGACSRFRSGRLLPSPVSQPHDEWLPRVGESLGRGRRQQAASAKRRQAVRPEGTRLQGRCATIERPRPGQEAEGNSLSRGEYGAWGRHFLPVKNIPAETCARAPPMISAGEAAEG